LIYYVATRASLHTLAPLVLYFRTDLSDFVRIVPYDRLHLIGELSSGCVVWTDMDRLDASTLTDAIAVHRELSRRPVHQLNDPCLSLRRFNLLRRLFDDGSNRFNVYRLADARSVQRFPVFIRNESGVAKKEPPLCQNQKQLQAAIAGLRVPGEQRDDLMIVELEASPKGDGLYRKYGAYRVGDCIYPQHVLFAPTWFVKNPEPTGDPVLLAEHLEYFESNPHAEELQRCFSLARIEYGRIDYCLADDRIQVFEINTNPAVLNHPPTVFDAIDSQPYADRHAEAMLRLPQATQPEDLRDPTQEEIRKAHNAVMASMRQKYRRRRIRLTVRKGLRRLATPFSGNRSK